MLQVSFQARQGEETTLLRRVSVTEPSAGTGLKAKVADARKISNRNLTRVKHRLEAPRSGPYEIREKIR